MATDLRVSHEGSPGSWVGLIKRGHEIVWRCPHRHTNRDTDTKFTSARQCAALVLAALTDPTGAFATINALRRGAPHFRFAWQAQEYAASIERREWALETSRTIHIPEVPRMLSFEGIDVAVLIHALYHATTAQGPFAARNDRPDLSLDNVRTLLTRFENKEVYKIDWLCGRPMKIDLNVTDSEFDPQWYDRDSGGDGTAAKVIAKLRTEADALRQVQS